ncbi:MAG TPA: hypothetical protein VF692_09435, partial [Pyrinomonadaceae bacterium]
MKIKTHLLRLAAGLAAFAVAVVVFSAFNLLRTQIFAPRPAEAIIESVSEIAPQPNGVEIKELPKNVEPVIVKEAESDFDASGEYYFSGEAPKGFADFEYLEIVA